MNHNIQVKVRFKKQSRPSRFLKNGCPWVFKSELEEDDISAKIDPGAWVELEDAHGQILGYGHYNSNSVLSFRCFEKTAFKNTEATRKVFFARLDSAHAYRLSAYKDLILAGQMGKNSFRLCFGESDGFPGLIVDLFEGTPHPIAVIQCHSAGADLFLPWTKQWLEEKLGIRSGVIRNDLDVRNKEKVALYVEKWGDEVRDVHCIEGGVRFFVDVEKGQKTGHFYDHRDNRFALSKLTSDLTGQVLDCFSYTGSWGLQLLKRNPKLKLTAIDISESALNQLMHNARENKLADRVEVLKADFFKTQNLLEKSRKAFDVVIVDPPALTSSSKHSNEGQKALENSFFKGMGYLKESGVIAFASCSYHLTWDDFLYSVSKTGLSFNKTLRIAYQGFQSVDHPVLSSLPETRYLKCAICL